MEDKTKLCQTCLCKDRVLFPLEKLKVLLTELNFEINYGSICWECKRLMERYSKFRTQALRAHVLLNCCEKIDNLKSFTTLSFSPKYYYDSDFNPHTNIQITCTESGPILIKQEITESVEDGHRQDTNQEACGDILQRNVYETTKPTETEDVNMLSDLPRITLVESITEHTTEASKDVQAGTEIELNIPIPLPIAVDDQHKNTDKTHSNKKQCRAVPNKTVNVTKTTAKEKDTITVKVVMNGSEGSNVKVKEEPVSDAEDVANETATTENSTLQEQEKSFESTVELSVVKEECPEDELKKYMAWKKSILLVYSRLRNHKYASRFAYPITNETAPQYSQVVKRPMDLSTIRKNIQNGVIRNTAEFQRDLLLMLSNALMYNSSDHFIYDMTQDFLIEVKYQLAMLLAVHTGAALPEFMTTPRSRRRVNKDIMPPPAKRPKLDVKPKISEIKPNINTAKTVLNPLHTSKHIADIKPTKQTKTNPKIDNKAKTSEKCSKTGTSSELLRNAMNHDHNYTSILVPKLERITITPNKVNTFTYSTPNNETKNIKVEPTEPDNVRRSQRVRKPKLHTLDDNYLAKPKKRKSKTKSPKIKTEPLLVPKVEKKSRKNKNENDFCVAITTDNLRDLTRDEASTLKKMLEEEILSLALDFSKFAPRFRGKPIIADGVIKLWCEDQKSLQWLTKIINNIPIKFGKFVVKKQNDLPKKFKCGLLVPGSTDDVEVILKLVKAQNPWALVDSWAMYSAEQRGESMFLVLGIPSTVIPVLVANERRLAYSLGSVYIKFYVGDQLSDNPPES